MRKKSGFTFIEQAIVLVPEFKMVVHKLEQQFTLRAESEYFTKLHPQNCPFCHSFWQASQED